MVRNRRKQLRLRELKRQYQTEYAENSCISQSLIWSHVFIRHKQTLAGPINYCANSCLDCGMLCHLAATCHVSLTMPLRQPKIPNFYRSVK